MSTSFREELADFHVGTSYYDRTKANRFEELFTGTWIGNHPTSEHSRYMIIRYDFSAMVMANNIEGLAQNFNDQNCGPVEVTANDSFLRTFFKVIKKGIGEGTVHTCFCTGVLPVTMDDLTSGYNIAEILTLEPTFLNMLGFTYKETEVYLRYVLDKYATGQDHFDEIWQLIASNYDGYRFRPNGDRLFNSTILTYFFKKFAANAGSIPDELVDENLRTDINWIRRPTFSLENAKRKIRKRNSLIIRCEHM